MNSLVFARLRKVEEDDDGFLHVAGIASSETEDRSGEVITADAIKAALPDFMAHGTGALRSMHKLDAVGRVDRAEVDAQKRTKIEATVVDPLAITKVQAGVFKGFSIGGRVVARDPKDSNRITKIVLNEISLVDRPCNPEAVFGLWKADGFEGARREDRDAEIFRKADEAFEALGRLESAAAVVEKRLSVLVENLGLASRSRRSIDFARIDH